MNAHDEAELTLLLKQATLRRNPAAVECVGKLKFTSYTDAQHGIHRNNRKPTLRREPYKCRHCGSYHTGERRLVVDRE